MNLFKSNNNLATPNYKHGYVLTLSLALNYCNLVRKIEKLLKSNCNPSLIYSGDSNFYSLVVKEYGIGFFMYENPS